MKAGGISGRRPGLVLDQLPQGALVVQDGVVTALNARGAHLLGVHATAVVGQPLRELVHDDHRDRVDGLLADALGGTSGVVVRRAGDPPAWLALDAADTVVLVRDATQEVRTFRILREIVWTATVTDSVGVRHWGPVGREHPEDRPNQVAGSAVDRVHPEDLGAVLEAFARIITAPGAREQVDARLHVLGQDHHDHGWTTGTVEMMNARSIPEIDGLLLWITERATARPVASLARTDSAFLSVAEAAPVGIVLTGPAGFPAYFNEAARSMLPGVGTGEANRDWIALAHPDERDELRRWVDQQTESAERASRTAHFCDHEGRSSWLLVTIAPRRGEDGILVGHVITLQDVTAEMRARHELEETQHHLVHLATHDPLTGLANRTLLDDALDRFTATGHPTRGPAPAADAPVGMLFCDLDGFKEVNDELGHEAGDEVLVEVARRLRSATDEADLVARIGGDEFLVLTPRTPDRLAALAEHLVATITAPIDIAGRLVSVGISIGSAQLSDGESMDELLRRADRDMYRTKTGAGSDTA